MKLKKDLDQVLNEIQEEVVIEVKRAFVAPTPQYYGQDVVFSMNDVISQAIARGVAAGIAKLVDSQYTDTDFERDLGLDQT